VGLLPPLLYFGVIVAKGTLGLLDAAVLGACYFVYLALLLRLPPREEDVEEDVEVPRVSRWALSFSGAGRWMAVLGLFLGGGLIPYFTAHPFLNSLLARRVDGCRNLVPCSGSATSRSSREGLRVHVGAADHPRAGRAHEHGLLEHQPVVDLSA
jgi:hypothetical protein